MAIKRFFRRKKKGRGEAKSTQPFIQAESAQHEGTEGNSFFLPREMEVQAKTKVSEAGDEREKQADAAADRAMHRKKEAEKHRKHQEEEKKARHKKDKMLQHHPEDEHTIHRKEGAGSGAGVSAGAGKVAASGQANGGSATEGGRPLEGGLLHEMSSSMGYDLSSVKIHTGPEAQSLSEQLGAQAFTHGDDIYFNKGKFDPQSRDGQWLLAHELAHVVQQKAGSGLTGEAPIQRKEVPGISTPVPDKFVVKTKKKVLVSAAGQIKHVRVEVLPDRVGAVPAGKSGATRLSLAHTISAPIIKKGKIETAGVASVSLTIRTTFVSDAAPAGPSKFGAGTTAADIKAGNTSLRFHEGSHGSSAIDFVSSHPIPVFEGKAGMTEADYNKAVKEFKAALDAYHAQMLQESAQLDCVGNPEPGCKTP